jgi:hypothetical protein
MPHEAEPRARQRQESKPALSPKLIKANLEHRAEAGLAADELPRHKHDNERVHGARAPPIPRVIPFLEWCRLRGISESTGRRLIRAGKVKITDLSARRIGVREDHDREYLESCLRGGA